MEMSQEMFTVRWLSDVFQILEVLAHVMSKFVKFFYERPDMLSKLLLLSNVPSWEVESIYYEDGSKN